MNARVKVFLLLFLSAFALSPETDTGTFSAVAGGGCELPRELDDDESRLLRPTDTRRDFVVDLDWVGSTGPAVLASDRTASSASALSWVGLVMLDRAGPRGVCPAATSAGRGTPWASIGGR